MAVRLGPLRAIPDKHILCRLGQYKPTRQTRWICMASIADATAIDRASALALERHCNGQVIRDPFTSLQVEALWCAVVAKLILIVRHHLD